MAKKVFQTKHAKKTNVSIFIFTVTNPTFFNTLSPYAKPRSLKLEF